MAEKEVPCTENVKSPVSIFFRDIRSIFKLDELGQEIARIALPAALALTADPVASLVDTAFIGHIGPIEQAAVGVSIAVFNQASKIAIFPLVSVTTSFVAEEDTITKASQDLQNDKIKEQNEGDAEAMDTDSPSNSESKSLIPKNGSVCKSEKMASSFEVVKPKPEKRHIPSASSALIIGAVLGIIQAAFLIAGAKPLLKFMGIKPGSAMSKPAEDYLRLRSLGAPAVLLSLAMQGVFRGFKDTKTPLFATVAGDLANIILDPIFMFVFRLGVRGAAIAHVISQYLISVILFWRLMEKVDLVPPSLKYLQFARFLTNGFLLLVRVIAVTFCVTLAASLAARLGPTQMAAFQVCLQVWLATSLLADGLAVAGQAILASAFAQEDFSRCTATASKVLQLGVVLGLVLALTLGVGLHYGARVFTQDVDVLHLIAIGIPFVAATQPINCLAFVFDGVNFGASDFAYSAYSMLTVAIFSIVFLLILSSSFGYIGIWVALTIYMSLRALAGFGRIGTGTGPWKFLRS
ncbi:protein DETOXIFICATION 42-like isoform X3 [Nicotiana tomentosiformis]|uniref:Protein DETOXIFICATION n=1 Tax=Nicotiana tabacum TaxID=4097 RepID=A0A1S3WXD3_TOBAC|nr:protein DETOXIFICATION 42-like isoform X1 [Nicotiana tomentosiformis]XP_009613883.1 protein DETOXIFICATION 42-like isoform X1 [Nicotiana tomentosiformis]XP_016432325.1 PREDICTED: protein DETOXIFICATION 42-like [Nicotiana tabacum]XP_016432328.1 PREDICTED: protein DETOXIFICATION 42-like [Nicotiana tabacum]